MSECTGLKFSMEWPIPWGGDTQQPVPCGVSVVRTAGEVADGVLAVFADGTGKVIRAVTAADLQTWLQWASSHIPVNDGSNLYQPVRYVEVEGVYYLEKAGDPVAPPWA